MAEYSRGSEWRKWDLHIHTPCSIVQEYGGDTEAAWNAFIAALRGLPPDIKVIGVTDYLFCDGYEKLLARRDEIPNIELILPNIEFRLNTFSGQADNTKRHNYHVIFDPLVPIADIREQLLNCLSTGYKIADNSEWSQTPTRRSLAELGKQIKAAAPGGNTIHDKSDIEVGFDNITYKREDIEKLLRKSPFKGKYVTAIGYSEWNASRWDQSAAEKRSLINSSQFALTSNNDPAAIAAHIVSLKANKLNSLVLQSSDAHKLEQVGKTLLWIKADPTFAGLKQVLNEPEARVFIGETPPNFKPSHKIISKLTIPGSSGWFPDNFALDLNRDLVTIIGGRGSGKSALAEAIAFGAGSVDKGEDAFLRKAAKHPSPITGSAIALEWADGSTTSFSVGDVFEDKQLVRYLPQGVVEELCSHKNSEILQHQIENVIFQSLDQTQKLGASSFEELKTRVLADFKYEKEQVVRKLRYVNKRIAALSTAIRTGPAKERALEQQKAELDRLTKGLPELPAEDKKGQEELAALIVQRKKFEAKIIELRNRLAKITEAETIVKVFKNRIVEYQAELDPVLTALGIKDRSVFEVKMNSAGITALFDAAKKDINALLQTLKDGGKAEVSQALGVTEADLTFDNLAALNAGIADKEKATQAFETTKLKYQQEKAAASAAEEKVKALEAEIARITAESIPELAQREAERETAYVGYFEVLRREKAAMEELYGPLQKSLLAGTETDKKLKFEARINYRAETHCRNGLDIIDRTHKGAFRDASSLRDTLEKLRDELTRTTYSDQSLRDGMMGISAAFETYENKKITIESQLRENSTLEDFYNWLFDTSVFEIVSSLTFDNTDLYVLSPGQKGIILLMLYLEIDKEDNRPLIVDQPEENLDNLSVYKDLIEFFRDRKRYRQIIMVTHNPNLVVNTDAEQVVVANYDGGRKPRLNYTAGSLEDQAKLIPDVPIEDLEDGIIEQVCNILEGGEPAFDKRKRKYQLSRKSTF
jgi:energy-coupling factor transporter ATP-binding protein EcfA2